jgi:hypothetical protein
LPARAPPGFALRQLPDRYCRLGATFPQRNAPSDHFGLDGPNAEDAEIRRKYRDEADRAGEGASAL